MSGVVMSLFAQRVQGEIGGANHPHPIAQAGLHDEPHLARRFQQHPRDGEQGSRGRIPFSKDRQRQQMIPERGGEDVSSVDHYFLLGVAEALVPLAIRL